MSQSEAWIVTALGMAVVYVGLLLCILVHSALQPDLEAHHVGRCGPWRGPTRRRGIGAGTGGGSTVP